MKGIIRFLLAAVILLVPAGQAGAHFQVILPSDDIVEAGENSKIGLSLIFTHPMEQGPAMEMGQPVRFGVLAGGQKTDLLANLRPVKVDGKTAFETDYELKAPADYIFFVDPAPYWEPAEAKMIIHYTKVVVDAFGAEEGWQEPVGQPVEIEPLVRPYGLWTGNLFRGVVKLNGQPVPFAEVEVEYYNQAGIKPPTELHITQVVRADANGTFAYAMPKAGWWGFAALVEGPEKLKNPQGELVPVELGGLIWVKTYDMKGR